MIRFVDGERLTYRDVPRDVISNLRWRAEVREWALLDVRNQIALREWIKADVRLFIAGFCWLFEPRDDRETSKTASKILPFIPWNHQEAALDKLLGSIGYEDVGFDKSRGEGATWLVLMVLLHEWLSRPLTSYGLVSRNVDACDNPDDPDSLMWKLDWELKQIPSWLVPRFDRSQTKHTLLNMDNGSTIVGYAATGDVARGGRKTAFLMDEIASFNTGEDQAAMNSTSQVTNCRILVSTPKGPYGSFYEAMNTPNNMVKISLRWQQNPLRNRGLYKVHEGRPHLIDWQYWRNRTGNKKADEQTVKSWALNVSDDTNNNVFKYAFMLKGPYVREGRERSPWYDTQCRRPSATPRSIAQELDLDYAGASKTFFDINALTQLQRSTCWPPTLVGDLLYDENVRDTKTRFSKRPGGSLMLWCPLIPGRDHPAQDRQYVMGVDVSSGLGGEFTHNSSLSVLDERSREQVAELARPDIKPAKLAWYAYCLGWWFRGPNGPALIIPEVNGGYGQEFVKVLRELGYPAIYRRDSLDESSGNRRKVKHKYGWFSGKAQKKLLFQELEHALLCSELKARSFICLEEAKGYVENAVGKLIHVNEMSSDDGSAETESHGDRAVALALAWRAVRQSDVTQVGENANVDVVNLPNSVAGRLAQLRKPTPSAEYVW